ncbi:hypothetical protein BS47DRAFT_1457316 [Hydnum rufescens UP504]|uniref:Uncharacterized protein n=1 Tax=Hydnum rufescens UP504 TaxID=1448309 RepID=A0A9P6AYJ5_9AGAM|nr:hypothetical protein BS47DRAFT_1457316 [Hydnum rufescens UP504]
MHIQMSISGSIVDRPAEPSMANLVNKCTEALEMSLDSGISLRGPVGPCGTGVGPTPTSTHTPHSLILLYKEEYRSIRVLSIFIHTYHHPKNSLLGLGHARPPPGANYECSEIVFNQRVDTKKVNVGNRVYTPYGNDKPIQGGNRTPDVPNLVLVPVAAEATMATTLFDLLTPSVHTTFVFELPENQSRGPLQLRTS